MIVLKEGHDHNFSVFILCSFRHFKWNKRTNTGRQGSSASSRYLIFVYLQDPLGKQKAPVEECCQWQLWAQASQAHVFRNWSRNFLRLVNFLQLNSKYATVSSSLILWATTVFPHVSAHVVRSALPRGHYIKQAPP